MLVWLFKVIWVWNVLNDIFLLNVGTPDFRGLMQFGSSDVSFTLRL